MYIRDIMTARPITIAPEEAVSAAARLLSRCNLGALPVTDRSGHLRGIVTDRDITLRCVALENDPQKTKISEIMSRGIVTAAPDDTVSAAAARMAKEQVRRLPVTENERLVGMVSLSDLARREDCRKESAEALGSISANLLRRGDF